MVVVVVLVRGVKRRGCWEKNEETEKNKRLRFGRTFLLPLFLE